MARYIDADLALKLKDKDMNYAYDLYDLEDFLAGVPTADVVEVVRCKQCKYGEIVDEDFPNQYLCRHNGCDWNDENHFCGYGERRDT